MYINYGLALCTCVGVNMCVCMYPCVGGMCLCKGPKCVCLYVSLICVYVGVYVVVQCTYVLNVHVLLLFLMH